MKIKQLQLTKAIFVPGVGQLANTLGNQHNPAVMETIDGGILCQAKRGIFIVPWSMVETAFVGPIPEKKESNVKAADKKTS